MTQNAVAVRLTKTAVHCGDHGQDMFSMVEVAPDETLVAAANRLLRTIDWRGENASAEYEWYLTVQLVQPAQEAAKP